MLYLYFNTEPDRIPYCVAADVNWLDGNDKYIADDFCRDFIKDIDNTEVVDENIVHNASLGNFLPRLLSSGAHGLLLLYASDKYFAYSSQFGENCIKWLHKLGKIKDVHIVIDYDLVSDSMEMEDEFNAIVVDDGYVMHTYEDYFETVLSFKYREDEDLDPE